MNTNGTLWYSPRPSIRSWDGIDSIANGTLWYDSSPSISSHGEMGWDGQWGHKWDTLVPSQTILWDSQCTIGRLLAILDMCANSLPVMPFRVACQRSKATIESYCSALSLLDQLFLANATLHHSEPSMNYISDMKPWGATVTDL